MLCEWRLLRDSRRYDELAASLGVEEQVGILCRLPSDGRPREADACTLHQRRSNRDRVGHPGFGQANRGRNRMDQIEALRAEARRHLDGARTLLAMSRFLGHLPESCETADGQRRCTWRLSDQSYGHGSVARAIGADLQRKIDFTCRFPEDGSLRAPGSCEGEPGGGAGGRTR